MKLSNSRRALLRALSGATALYALAAAPAGAQTMTSTERQAPDANGVDVISGTVTVPIQSITAGRPGEGGLTYLNGWAGGQYFDTFKVEIKLASSTVITVFGSAKRFTDNGNGTYTTVDGDGSTLVFDSGINGYIYTTRDGTVFKFLKSLGDTGIGALVIARISTITKPDGEVIAYHHRLQPGQGCSTFPCTPLLAAGRVQSVTSSLGYQLKATYASNTYGSGTQADFKKLTKVTAINNAVDYCDPDVDTCSGLTQTWPQLTIASSVSSGVTTQSFTDALSQATTVTSNASGVTGVTSPASSTADLTITYDTNNRVATLSRGGGSWGYTYADSGSQRTTTVTQPIGGSRIYVSDLNSKRVLSVTDELGRTTAMTYDSFGRATRQTAPEGNYTELSYDSRGNVILVTNVAKASSGLANVTASASFDSSCANPKTCNQPNSTTDALGKTTDFTYDSTHGGLLTVTAPAPVTGGTRPQTRPSYTPLSAYYKNSAGAIVAAPSSVYRMTGVSACQTTASCAGTSDEVKTTIAYGATGVANNLLATSSTSGDGTGTLAATTALAYDLFGNLTSVDSPLTGSADTVGFRYDALRRRTMTVSPDPDGAGPLLPRAVRTTFDPDGNVLRVESGNAPTLTGTFTPTAAGVRREMTYDSLGRLESEALETGPYPGVGTPLVHSRTHYSYDIKGRLDCVAQRMNMTATLPSSACALGTQGSFGPDRIVKRIYDNGDQVAQVRTAFATLLEAAEVTSTYRANGQIETLTDGEGNKTTYEYDGFDRLSKTLYPTPTPKGAGTSNSGDYEQSTYDAGSNVLSFRNRAGETIGFGYDNLSRVVSKDLPGSEPDVTYTYDLLGRMTGAGQSGNALSFSFDALGRNLTAGGPLGTVNYTYDLAGRRTRMTWPDTFYVEYDYLVTGEMQKIRENGTTTGVGVLATYAYDDRGRRTSLTRGNGTVLSYGFDTASRTNALTDDSTGTGFDQVLGFSFNPANQIVQTTRSNDSFAWNGHYNVNRSYSSNGLNQYTASGSITPGYDTRGNLTSAGSTTYGYSSENLLKTATGGITLAYDPAMRLYETVGSATTRFQYDGVDLIAEYNTSGTLLRAMSTARPLTSLSSGTKAPVPPTDASYTRTSAARSSPPRTVWERSPPPTPMTNMASPARRTPAGSSIPDRPGCLNSACIITRPASTRPRSDVSFSRTPSAIEGG
jgi:YD repeat-containing protein